MAVVERGPPLEPTEQRIGLTARIFEYGNEKTITSSVSTRPISVAVR
jgi:hypothetical protein